MTECFNVKFEFDPKKIEGIAKDLQIQKGYCCFIDFTVLTEANENTSYREIINEALINSCDGSYIALLASFIQGQNYSALNGPVFFNKYVFHEVDQCVIGNTIKTFEKAKEIIHKENPQINIQHIPLPFNAANEFDYENIADRINELKPRYIWVSLGAPKQEIFMHKLYPHIDYGIMFGIGAALNYFSGEKKAIPPLISKLHLIWIYRIIQEPRKQFKRVFKTLIVLPKLILREILKRKSDVHI